jgi:hypothetical protein
MNSESLWPMERVPKGGKQDICNYTVAIFYKVFFFLNVSNDQMVADDFLRSFRATSGLQCSKNTLRFRCVTLHICNIY